MIFRSLMLLLFFEIDADSEEAGVEEADSEEADLEEAGEVIFHPFLRSLMLLLLFEIVVESAMPI